MGRKSSIGHDERIQRDGMGDRTRTMLGDHVVEHVNDALSREIVRRLPNGGAIESAYDPAGRLVRRSGQIRLELGP